MSIPDRITADFMTARKARDSVRSNILGVIRSELINLEKSEAYSKTGKKASDDDAIRIMRKLIVSNKEILQHAPDNEQAAQEITIMEEYLPQMMDDAKLEEVISGLIHAQSQNGMGAVMAGLKANYAGQYDGKRASEIAKRLLGQ